MTKRIVSGVFLLVALGALGLILAGALTSGEQLIVRFLTAIIVAALGLYVISDLRLQADDSAVANAATGKTPVTSSRVTSPNAPPPNSTAAFMATVTGKKSTTASLDDGNRNGVSAAAPTGQIPVVPAIDDDPADLDTLPGTIDESAAAHSDTALNGAARRDTANNDTEVDFDEPTDDEDETEIANVVVSEHDLQPLSIAEEDQSPYSEDDLEVGQWPLTPDGKILEQEAGDTDEEEIDGLVAVFTKQAEQELRRQEPAMANAQLQPVLVGGEADDGTSSFKLGDVFKSFSQPSATDSPDNPAAGNGEPPEALNGNHRSDGDSSAVNGSGNGSSNGSSVGSSNGHVVNANGVNVSSASANGDDDSNDSEATDTANTPIDTDTQASTDISAAADTVADSPSDNTNGGPSEQATSLPRPEAELEAASYAQARIIDLRLNSEATEEIEAAIRSGEVDVISSLMTDGVLSAEGPISDRDVRTMVYVAFTSNELRKILLAGGTVDADPESLDLGPVEVFSESARATDPELITARVALATPSDTADGTDAASTSPEGTNVEPVTPDNDELTENASI